MFVAATNEQIRHVDLQRAIVEAGARLAVEADVLLDTELVHQVNHA